MKKESKRSKTLKSLITKEIYSIEEAIPLLKNFRNGKIY